MIRIPPPDDPEWASARRHHERLLAESPNWLQEIQDEFEFREIHRALDVAPLDQPSDSMDSLGESLTSRMPRPPHLEWLCELLRTALAGAPAEERTPVKRPPKNPATELHFASWPPAPAPSLARMETPFPDIVLTLEEPPHETPTHTVEFCVSAENLTAMSEKTWTLVDADGVHLLDFWLQPTNRGRATCTALPDDVRVDPSVNVLRAPFRVAHKAQP